MLINWCLKTLLPDFWLNFFLLTADVDPIWTSKGISNNSFNQHTIISLQDRNFIINFGNFIKNERKLFLNCQFFSLSNKISNFFNVDKCCLLSIWLDYSSKVFIFKVSNWFIHILFTQSFRFFFVFFIFFLVLFFILFF